MSTQRATSYIIWLLAFLSMVPAVCSAWKKPVELYSNNKSVTNPIGLYIDPTTLVHHVVFQDWGLDTVYYMQFTVDGKQLRNQTFTHPTMSYTEMGALTTSNKGKRLHLLLNGQVKKSNGTRFGVWYTESQDQGLTWSKVIRVNQEEDEVSRLGSAMFSMDDNGRVFVFYTSIVEVEPLVTKEVIIMVSKPPNSTLFTKEVNLFKAENGLAIRNSLTAQYSMRNGKPVIHLLWATGFSRPDSVYHSISLDYGVTWSNPQSISGGAWVYPYDMMESAVNQDISTAVAGIYYEYAGHRRKLYVTKDHGNTFNLFDASPSGKDFFDQYLHKAGVAICGTKEKPIAVALVEGRNGPFIYSILDINTMKLTLEEAPFKEFGDDSYGVMLACVTTKEGIMISALTEMGYGKPVRHITMNTEIRKS